jgi:ABC-type glycerol-3-phosphate transport system substrate-binding protein
MSVFVAMFERGCLFAMIKKVIALLCFVIISSLSGCTDGETSPYNDIKQYEVEGDETAGLQGYLTIWTTRGDLVSGSDGVIRFFANRFVELHPNVNITIEHYIGEEGGIFLNATQKAAFMTSLLAQPPDILAFPSSSIVFDKIDPSMLFVDLNKFFDGNNGIDRRDFFDNIFRATEIRGNLYHVPISIGFPFALLNTRLFDSIGLCVSTIEYLTVDCFLDFYFLVAQANTNYLIGASYGFNIVHYVALLSNLYDVDSLSVFADTPQMLERFEKATEIPTGSWVIYTPEGVRFIREYFHWNYIFSSLATPSDNLYITSLHPLDGLAVAILFNNHPDMQFSHPVLWATDNGYARFNSHKSLSVMQNSQNQELAWEFIRYILEFTEYLPLGATRPFCATTLSPNRIRTLNNMSGNLELMHRLVWDSHYRHGFRHDNEQIGDSLARHKEYFEDFVMSTMEMLQYHNSYNYSVLHSLIYPDLWLLVSDQQNVAQALTNMHNRLHLFVNE